LRTDNLRLKAGLMLLVALLGLWWVYRWRAVGAAQDSASAPHEGFVAPDFTLPALDGNQVALSQFRGRGVILVFWVTWCHICQAELPMLQDVYERYHGQGLEVVAVNYKDSPRAVQAFVQEKGLGYHVLLDRGGAVNSLYRVRGFPTTVFISPDGKIVKMTVGGRPSEAFFMGEARKLLPKK
jgi:cytochrome c biogenesis protein CcmG/thiol:disulfide interchange protein DsbE